MSEKPTEKLRGTHLIGDLEEGYMDVSFFKIYGFAYIWNFRIADKNLGTGLAQKLFDEFVSKVVAKGIYIITGKFSPDEGKEIRARRFYERNGFAIDINGNMRKKIGEG